MVCVATMQLCLCCAKTAQITYKWMGRLSFSKTLFKRTESRPDLLLSALRWAAVHGVAKSWTQLSDFTFTFHFHALEKEMATHSSTLAWRIPGTGEPGGLLSIDAQSRTRLKRLSSSSSSLLIVHIKNLSHHWLFSFSYSLLTILLSQSTLDHTASLNICCPPPNLGPHHLLPQLLI